MNYTEPIILSVDYITPDGNTAITIDLKKIYRNISSIDSDFLMDINIKLSLVDKEVFFARFIGDYMCVCHLKKDESEAMMCILNYKSSPNLMPDIIDNIGSKEISKMIWSIYQDKESLLLSSLRSVSLSLL